VKRYASGLYLLPELEGIATRLTMAAFSTGLTSWTTSHWVIGGIITSLIWFFAGHQSSTSKKPQLALAWLSVAVLVIIVLCGWTVVRREWLGLVLGLVVLYVEVRLIKRIASQTSAE
jgi:hypothetical protein